MVRLVIFGKVTKKGEALLTNFVTDPTLLMTGCVVEPSLPKRTAKVSKLSVFLCLQITNHSE